ncbi:MBL fold metallo-hydrolase [Rufibacter roseus]|uniref:Rhodanese-like domain-containing protein n=1 Tax=Rufibacter roseus TaxID=1567108 RepID=A0ABW2DI33_9BACT|nr:rhodanese-like domain-containing protein [Rufibacter roseus]
MKIHQFEDKGLAHFSYTIMSDAEIVVIDPARDPRQYEEFAMMHDAKIVAIIETHPHADFVSGHLELSQAKQTPIYVSAQVEAKYKHTPFDQGDEIKVGKVTLRALNTPGHSPDSISVLLLDEDGKENAVFTGDSLLIGDVGRPDLREDPDDVNTSREALARQMYHTTREVLMKLPDHVVVYPAHGAGSLCSKSSSDAKSSTIGDEKRSNPSLQPMTEDDFVAWLTKDQPFVPKYFARTVQLNREGSPEKFDSLVKKVPKLAPDHPLEDKYVVIDARPQEQFKQGHLEGSFNIQEGAKFETWLGTILEPEEKFYLLAEGEETIDTLIARSASIGYDQNIVGAFSELPTPTKQEPTLDLASFRANPDDFTIVDIRNANEVRDKQIFAHAINIPLPELRERVPEIPLDKPIVVHCASGYRSAAGASIISVTVQEVPVYDLSEAVKTFG